MDFLVEDSDLISGLNFEVFEGSWNRLPDFNQLTPVSSGVADAITLDLPELTQDDEFGARFTGFIEVPQDDTYTFYTTSDDGSQLSIGETVVVDNDGLHAARERSGEIELSAGKHPLTVTFFEKFGEETLSVSLEGGGLSKQVLPATSLFREQMSDHSPTPELPDEPTDDPSPPENPTDEIRDAELWEFEEWSLGNSTYSGNPFDVVARVTFEHQGSDASHSTEMFYDGNDTWRFRFTGTETGTWTYQTASADSDLDGFTGTIEVSPNPEPEDRGFLTNEGTIPVRPVDGNGKLEPLLLNIYEHNPDIGGFRELSPESLSALMQKAQNLGFDIVYGHSVAGGWFDQDDEYRVRPSDKNPSIQTFEVLEAAIEQVSEAGMVLHLWQWGDAARQATSHSLPNGFLGEEDQRLMRYIAARLGPLTGWTMSYGFDLQEYTNVDEMNRWASFLKEKMGWEHLLMARGMNSSETGVLSYSGIGNSYETALNNIENDSTRPHLFEERDLYQREGLSMEWTRQHLWRYTMAGGHGGFWGIGWWDNINSYPNPEQIQTFNDFWNKHLLVGMKPANALSDGLGMKTADNRNFVFYKENTSALELDLSSANGSQPAVAINTKTGQEIDLGSLDSNQQTIPFPSNSDWAIAVGNW